MLKRAIPFVAVISCCVSVFADYVEDRKAAIKLVGAGKYEEAMAAFTTMAGGDVTEFQKSDALEQAALCAHRLKRYDQAMELGKQIPLAPVSKTCQMKIMVENRKWKEAVLKFKDEDIASWPDTVIGSASYHRGRAYYFLKDGENAAKDMARAADYLVEDNVKGLALNTLGDTYQHLLKDDEKAIAAYRRCYSTRNIYKQCHAAMAIANIFTRQKKFDEAIQELDRLGLANVKIPYWRALMLVAYGEVLAAQGNKAGAIAKYQEALQLEGAPAYIKGACQKALKKLQAVEK